MLKRYEQTVNNLTEEEKTKIILTLLQILFKDEISSGSLDHCTPWGADAFEEINALLDSFEITATHIHNERL